MVESSGVDAAGDQAASGGAKTKGTVSTAKGGPSKAVDPNAQSRSDVSQALKNAFEAAVHEAVPDEMLDLLAKLN